MSSRSFTVFQDVPTSEPVKSKPTNSTNSNVITTRSSARLNNSLQGGSTLGDAIPIDKENVHPVTGERAGATGTSKKRKTSVLAAKSAAPLAIKKIKSSKEGKDVQPEPKKRKAVPSATAKGKVSAKKEGKVSSSSRKTSTKRVVRKASLLPRLEEEAEVKGQAAEHVTQATIDSRCYELTVQPLADVSQAYDAIEPTQDASPASKIKFRKDTSSEPEIRDFFSSSDTLISLPSTSTVCGTPTGTVESRKFSTPERKQIYAAFTFSTPSPTSGRFHKSSSRSGSIPRLDLA